MACARMGVRGSIHGLLPIVHMEQIAPIANHGLCAPTPAAGTHITGHITVKRRQTASAKMEDQVLLLPAVHLEQIVKTAAPGTSTFARPPPGMCRHPLHHIRWHALRPQLSSPTSATVSSRPAVQTPPLRATSTSASSLRSASPIRRPAVRGPASSVRTIAHGTFRLPRHL